MKHYGASNLTPLDPNSLQQVRPKGSDWSTLVDEDHAYVVDNGITRIYNWVIASTRDENIPRVVIPDGNLTGTGRWEEQEFSGAGANVKEIWTVDDFNPSGGIITLESMHYQIKDLVDIGTNRFVFDSGNPVALFEFDDSFNQWIEHSGDSMTLFSGTGNLRLLHGKGCTFFMTGDNVQFVDIIGSFGAQLTYIEFTGTGCSIGNVSSNGSQSIATGGILIRESLFLGWEDGIYVTGGEEVSMRDVFATASPSATGTFLSVNGASGKIVLAKELNVELPVTANFINIDPTLEITTTLDNIFISDGADFFKADTKSGLFTAAANATIAPTSITGVTDSSGKARFAFTGTTVYECQKVVNSGFLTALSYNGTWIISATDGTSWFEIEGIEYVSNDTGSFQSDSVTLTETGTTVADCDSILIDTDEDTTYDLGSYVYNKQTNSFQINAFWDGTQSGTWRNGSQTEKSKYVTVTDSGSQPSSYSLSSIYVSGNVEVIACSADDWLDLDLGTVIDSPSSARFKMINPVTGEVEYTGLNPINGIMGASISALKALTSPVLHQFRAIKTVGSAFETIIAERSLTNSLGNLVLQTPATFEPGDRFKIQIKAVGTDTDVTVQNIVASFMPA